MKKWSKLFGCGHIMNSLSQQPSGADGVQSAGLSNRPCRLGTHQGRSSLPRYLKTHFFYLTHMHYLCIFIHMRTTLNIDDKILEKASQLTGVKEKTSLVRLGLEALIARESAKRLAKLGGTEDNLRSIPRRKSA